jgi:ABC-type nickel/cobalt efflux system permease component RcnA
LKLLKWNKKIFGAGTAAVVSPISDFPTKMFIMNYQKMKIQWQLKTKLENIQNKLEQDIFWMDC